MKPGIILWNPDPLKVNSLPDLFPLPFSPVHKHLKFSTVFGTSPPKRPKTIFPYDYPSTSMPKKTLFEMAMPSSFVSFLLGSLAKNLLP